MPPDPAPRPYRLLVLSAPSGAALDQAARDLADHLAAHPQLDLGDVAYTLATGRAAVGHRRMLVCRTAEEAISALRGIGGGGGSGGSGPVRVWNGAPAPGGPPPLSFLFAGVGDHYVQMGRGLYATEPVFRRELDRAADLLAPEIGVDLRALLYPEPAPGAMPAALAPARPSLRELLGRTAAPRAASPLDRTAVLHPALFAVEHALARLWLSWGIAPGSLLGYSVGEYTAACLAGVVSLESALHLVAFRARLVDALPPGAMLSVFLPEPELLPFLRLLPKGLSLAATNGPTLSVVAGPPEAVTALEETLRERRISCRRLAAGHPFHSAALEPVVPALLAEAATLDLRPPALPLVSNVTGAFLTAAEATDPGYWARHLCRTVRFVEGLATLTAGAPRAMVEIGPGNTLSSLALQPGLPSPPLLAVPSLPHAKDPEPDVATLATALGKLWLAGVEPDWEAYYAGEPRRRVPLPASLPFPHFGS